MHPSKHLAVVCALATLALPGLASAHLMTAGQGTLTVSERDAYLVVALPVAAFPGLDADGNGRAEPSELEARADDVARAITAGVRLEGDGVAAERLSLDFTLADHDGLQAMPSEHAVVMQHLRFAEAPERLSLAVDALANAAGASPVLVRARRGPAEDLVVLRPERTRRALFAGPFDAFREAVELGARHILAGYDHLAFLVALLAVGATLRRWMLLLSSFTAAHTVSLALAVYGVVHPSPRLVEPLIAASIVVMAARAWRRRGKPSPLAGEAALVFACGLLHGLGFAGALADLGVETSRRVATLAGFNAGLELGQAAFVGFVAAIFAGARAVVSGRTSRARPRPHPAPAA